jgi:hypothetical protein
MMKNKEVYSYCLDDKDVYLQGTKDQDILSKADHAYVVYEVVKCHDNIRNHKKIDPSCTGDECQTVDPKCAYPDEIEKWTRRKRIVLKTENQSINLNEPRSGEEVPIMKN